MIFIDTNVILRFILADDPQLSPQANKIFTKIESNIKVYLSPVIIAECVCVLLKVYKLTRKEISRNLISIINLENVLTENKKMYKEVFSIFASQKIDFEDAYLIALMRKKKINYLYSFDRDFDKFSRIKRFED